MIKWLRSLFAKPVFRELSLEEMGEIWGGDPISIGGAILGSAVIGAGSSLIAGRQQANAANNATNAQLGMFNTINEQQKPWREAGQTALGQIGAQSDYFNHQFNREDLNANLAPNFDFMREQGSGAVANMSNAMGGLGGNSLTAISKWNNDYAQNAYQQAFTNYNSQRGDIFNRLASIAGLGQAAGSNSATGASAFGGNIANSMMGAGNAQAAGTMGVGNSLGAIGTNLMGWTALNRLLGNGGGGAAGTLAGGPT